MLEQLMTGSTLPAGAPGASPAWRDYVALLKPRVVILMLFTVLVGMTLARRQAPTWTLAILGTSGIGLVAASAAALNHVIDQRIDRLMARTRGRPLPRGVLAPAQALTLAGALGASGLALLLVTTNLLCTLLTLASLLGYAVVYSLWLKPRTAQNIVIGGAAGATPPLLGWVAVTGQVEAGALALFAIVFVWTPPHFWALAIHRRDDYARAGVPMLPVTHGVAHTSRRILQYCVALVGVSLLPVALGTSGGLYAAGAVLLGLRFTQWAWRLRGDAALALSTFRFSIIYLSVLFALLLADHALRSLYHG